MVSTQGSDPCNPGSNPGRTSFFGLVRFGVAERAFLLTFLDLARECESVQTRHMFSREATKRVGVLLGIFSGRALGPEIGHETCKKTEKNSLRGNFTDFALILQKSARASASARAQILDP